MSNGTTYVFQFNSPDDSRNFLAYAGTFEVRAFHPNVGANKKDYTKVLVVSKTQSMNYNLSLLKSLTTKAAELNGVMI